MVTVFVSSCCGKPKTIVIIWQKLVHVDSQIPTKLATVTAITCLGYDCSCDDVPWSEILTAIYHTRTIMLQKIHFN